jgi:hypothetical protein
LQRSMAGRRRHDFPDLELLGSRPADQNRTRETDPQQCLRPWQ